MKNNSIQVDSLLKNALHSTETPSPELVQRVKNRQVKEETVLKNRTMKRSFGFIAAVIATVVLTTTAFAAWYLLKPSDVASKTGDNSLSAAFEGANAVSINESVASGDYMYTLLGIVSGKDISDHPIYKGGNLLNDRTYAVLAIQKADGGPMPATSDDTYADTSFYVSPYIKGEQPWQVNIHTMNGAHSEVVVDGVMYRIIECDTVTMFADRDLYLGVNTGSFYDAQAFEYDELTGALKANTDYEGSSALFTLPIDATLADPVQAQAYLDAMWGE